jgi:hypothetical protein
VGGARSSRSTQASSWGSGGPSSVGITPRMAYGMARCLRRAGTCSARAKRIAASGVHRQHRFEPAGPDPVLDAVVEGAAALPTMEASRHAWHVARIEIAAGTAPPCAPRLPALERNAVERPIAPRDTARQGGLGGGQRHGTADETPAPAHGTDTLHDHTAVIDAGGEVGGGQGRSVPQGNPDLKGVPPESTALLGHPSLVQVVMIERDGGHGFLRLGDLILKANISH